MARGRRGSDLNQPVVACHVGPCGGLVLPLEDDAIRELLFAVQEDCNLQGGRMQGIADISYSSLQSWTVLVDCSCKLTRSSTGRGRRIEIAVAIYMYIYKYIYIYTYLYMYICTHAYIGILYIPARQTSSYTYDICICMYMFRIPCNHNITRI